MSNPLIDKFYELFPERKETPKITKIGEFSKELEDSLRLDVNTEYIQAIHELQSSSIPVEPGDPLRPDVNTKYIQGKNSKVSIKLPELPYASHDPYWKEDTLLQIVEKVKTRDARAMNITKNPYNVGPFTTGMTTVILEIMIWDTP